MTGTREFEWSECVVHTLRQLWGEGHSAAEIGRRLGASKNAVVGKARRLALPGRPSPIWRGGPAAKRPARQKAVPARTPPAATPAGRAAAGNARSPAAPPAAAPVTAASPELCAWPARERRECCWPIGEPRTAGFRLCGAPARGRAPYCEAHSRSAYVRAQPERSNVGLKRGAAKQG